MALANFDPPRSLAWNQSGNGMAVRRCARIAKEIAHRCFPSAFANRIWTCPGDRIDCFSGLLSWDRHSDEVATDRGRCNSVRCCGLEALAHTASDLGWNAG